MNKQRGFTLIELVVVIIILGVLAAVAVPRMVNLSDDARNAAARGVGGAISSGTSMNYAKRQVSAASAVAVANANVRTAAVLSQFLEQGGVQLQNGAAPVGDQNFRVLALAGANNNCNAATGASTARCVVRATGAGTGIQDQPFTVFCAR